MNGPSPCVHLICRHCLVRLQRQKSQPSQQRPLAAEVSGSPYRGKQRIGVPTVLLRRTRESDRISSHTADYSYHVEDRCEERRHLLYPPLAGDSAVQSEDPYASPERSEIRTPDFYATRPGVSATSGHRRGPLPQRLSSPGSPGMRGSTRPMQEAYTFRRGWRNRSLILPLSMRMHSTCRIMARGIIPVRPPMTCR